MKAKRAQTINFRNAIYSGYLFTNSHTLQLLFDGPGILLFDCGTCVISNWNQNVISASHTIIIHPNRYITYYLSENIRKTIHPYLHKEADHTIYQNLKEDNSYLLQVGDEFYRVKFEDSKQKISFEKVEGDGSKENKRRIIQMQLKEHSEPVISQICQTISQYKYFMWKMSQILDFGNTIFQRCDREGHQRIGSAQIFKMFTKSPHKHENWIVVGVEYEHPKHEGNGLNLMIKHNHDEHIFYVHSIQVGTDLTYNKYSNTIQISSESVQVTQFIVSQILTYELTLEDPKSLKQIKETMSKLKKGYHMKSNNYVSRYIPQSIKNCFHEYLIFQKFQKSSLKLLKYVPQSILEGGHSYFKKQATVTDIQNEIRKIYTNKSKLKKQMPYSEPLFIDTPHKSETFKKTYPLQNYQTQIKTPKKYCLADLYLQKLSGKKRNTSSKYIHDKQIVKNSHISQKNEIEQEIEKHIKNIRDSEHKNIPKSTINRHSKKIQTQKGSEEQIDFLSSLTETYMKIRKQIKTEAKQKGLPIPKDFPYSAGSSKSTIFDNKLYKSRFS